MLDIKDVHLAIQGIQNDLMKNNAPIHINTVAGSMRAKKEDVAFYLNILQALGYVHFRNNSAELFSLTESGQSAYIY